MPDFLFAEAAHLWGSPVTWTELIAVVLALAMVGCNIREVHWGWPLAIASSLLYFALFWRNKLYGDAALQIFFAVIALWGWSQWLRGRRTDGSSLRVARLPPAGLAAVLVTAAVLWPLTAVFLETQTDTDVAWWDAFPTAVSVIGQFLLARKYLENWLVWMVVNAVSVGLFAFKGLWLTAGLYLVFIALSFAGWRAWRAKLA
jgi:nicotinamide mononucleotide transporter